jgi:hypothetical protein
MRIVLHDAVMQSVADSHADTDTTTTDYRCHKFLKRLSGYILCMGSPESDIVGYMDYKDTKP